MARFAAQLLALILLGVSGWGNSLSVPTTGRPSHSCDCGDLENHSQTQYVTLEEHKAKLEELEDKQKELKTQFHSLLNVLATGSKGISGLTLTSEELISQIWNSESPRVKRETGAPGSQHDYALPKVHSGAIKNGGAVYTRWGSGRCENDATLLYKGFAGGTFYGSMGGGTNFQCLPDEPEFQKSPNNKTRGGSMINGVEYQSFGYGIFPDSAHNQNVPCARCYTETRSAVMMIPAKRSCPAGWTQEYEGYLMSAYEHFQTSSTYECVDSHPEYVRGAEMNNDGSLMVFVKLDCITAGACSSYDSNLELSCVVCSK
ncbi:hypothetical protein EB796_004992 [Bugula neritina]|uniref:Uncharacterized protein n=1 Tax=Bugula neritina TaxID=10212 RepID=A0A7J7KEG8_BUGNE|nr:hypothetical protein EB796_004992 [Bugula neritina]